MATKQFQNAKLNVTHLDLKDDASRSVLQSGENISHSLGKIARWYKDIIWTDSKATTEVFGIVKLSDDYKSESTETVPTSKTLNDVVKLMKQTGGWNTTYDFNSNIDGDENLQNGQFKVTEHDLEGDIDHYVSIKGLGSAAFTESSAYATAGHTHKYAGSASVGGAATSANKLNTDAGSIANPVYFKNGIPVACTYSLNSTVPSDAVFTDTTYIIESGDSNGQIKITPSVGDPYNVSVKGLGSAAYTNKSDYATADHTHKYAGSDSVGGAATSANKLNTDAGSDVTPIYFSNGIPVACTYSLNKTVPSNALFTDKKVTQTATTINANYEVLFSGTADNTTRTEGARKNSNLTFNPSTGTLTATKFVGTLSGNATSATTANKLSNTTAIGSSIKPVYFSADGIPVAIDHSIETSVPSNAVFTDTTYTVSSGDSNGQIKVTPSEGDPYNVPVKGLGSAAYTDSTKYVYKNNTDDTLSQFDGSPSYLLGIESFANGGTVKWQRAVAVSVGSATKLSDIPAGGIGSETKPVFFSGTTGRPVACTYSLNANVPANAIFTDEKVKQSPVTTDGSFEVLFAGSTGNTAKTEGVGKTTTLTFNPSTGALSATSFSGNGSGLTTLNASNISSGTLSVNRLPGSAVTVGTYGPAAGGTLSHSSTFDVPDFTVDAKGRITGAHTRTFTLPAQYTHPTHTSKASGLYKITVDDLGHVSGTAAVTKSDIPALDYISSTTTRNPNVVLAGPASGTTAAAPTFRALVAADLPSSGATAGSYGPSENASPAHSGTFSVPYITVDNKGRVTDISTKTITLPTSGNTNNKVTQTATTTNADYEVLFSGTADNTTRTEGARKNSNLTFNPSTGTLTATKFVGELSGNATSASNVYSTNTPGSSSYAGYSIPFFDGPIDSSSPEKNDIVTSGNKSVLHNSDFRIGLEEGTTSKKGYVQLVLGNGIASGTAGNKYGALSLYSTSVYAVKLVTANLTASRTITLPDASGTISLSDNKVTQSQTNASSYRPIVFGKTNTSTVEDLAATITDQVYVSTNFYACPKTGVLYATEFSGSGASLTSLNASNISSGTLSADRLATSGATAGSYGPSANATPGYGATFNVPYITVDNKGRVTAISTKTVKIPASDNTNTTYTFATGDTNGTFKVTPSGGTATNIAIKGLGSAAYTASSAYATAGHTHNYAGSSSAGGPATSSNQMSISAITIQTGSSAKSYITLETLMNWLIDKKIVNSDSKYHSFSTSWSYSKNDILQISINGSNKEVQLAGVIFEIWGSVSTYNSGMFRLRIHTAPKHSYTNTSGYSDIGDATVIEYFCNGSEYSPTWRYVSDRSLITAQGTAGLYKIAYDNGGHITATSAITKADITGLGIPGSDTNTTYTFATGDNSGTFKVTPSGGSATNIAIKGISHVAGDSSGLGMTIGAGGLTVLGSGESASALVTAASLGGTNETLYLTSDNTIGFYVNCQTISERKGITLNKSLYLYPNNNNVGSVGTSANKWNTMYATTFHGALSGNATTASKWATARTLTLSGSVTGSVSIDGSGNVTLSTTTNHLHNYAGSASAGGPAYSVEGVEGATEVFRHVWFSTDSVETKRAYSDKFMFEPSSGILKFNSWYPLDITDNTVDLNSYNDGNGKYGYRRYICRSTGGGNKISNKPCDSPFLLEVFLIRFATASSDYITKQVYHAFNKKTYQRFCTSGTWDSWTELKYTDTNTDTKVTQTATTTNAAYEVLFSDTADNTTRTEGARKNSNLTFNPSTGVLATDRIYSARVTGTYLAGNRGSAIINSTAFAGAYVMLARMHSTNGYFTHGTYEGKYLLQYTAQSTIDAETNAVTKSVTLLNESGNSSFPGTVTATKFSGSGASLTSLNASNISSGTLSADRLATSGATAGSYGPSANATPGYGATFNVPYITIDAKGRVTGIENKTVKIPASDNTNTTYTFATGDTNGTFKVTPSGGSATNIAIKGLGSAAYTASSAYATSGHTHGLGHSNFTVFIDATTNTWAAIGVDGNKYVLKSIRTNDIAPPYLLDRYASGIVFGGSNTRGVLSISYSSPQIRFAGGSNTTTEGGTAKWYITLTGTHNTSYSLDTINHVKQSSITTAKYRGVILGTNNTTNATDTRETTVTGQGYITDKIFAQPSTGSLYATNMNAWVDGTGDVQVGLIRSGNSSWRFLNSGGTLSLQNNFYSDKVQSWYNVAQFNYNGANSIKLMTPPQLTGTNRSISYGYGSIDMGICSKNSWAMSIKWLNNARDTVRGSFGAYGAADALSYYYWGTAYNATNLRLYQTDTGGLVSQHANGFRMVHDGYGVIFRNDGLDFYILLTDKKTDGSELTGNNWNGKRPLKINLSSGKCNIDGDITGHSYSTTFLKNAIFYYEGSDIANKRYYRVAYAKTTNTYTDMNGVFLITDEFGEAFGIIKVRARTEATAGVFGNTKNIKWIINSGFDKSIVKLVVKNNYDVDTAKTGTATAEIWLDNNTQWKGIKFTILSQGWRKGSATIWTMSSKETGGSSEIASTGITSTINATNQGISNNAATSTIAKTVYDIDASTLDETIGIGYTGDGITASEALQVACFTSKVATQSGARWHIKDLSFDNLKTKLGLDYDTIFSGTDAASVGTGKITNYIRLVIFCKNISNSSFFTVQLQAITGYHYHVMTVSPPPASQTNNIFYGLLFNVEESHISVSAGKYSTLTTSVSLTTGPTVHITKVLGYKF